MFLVTYISGSNKQRCQMYFDGYIDDNKSDFVNCYRFFNCKDYMKHVYFTFARSSILNISEVIPDVQYDSKEKFLKRFENL